MNWYLLFWYIQKWYKIIAYMFHTYIYIYIYIFRFRFILTDIFNNFFIVINDFLRRQILRNTLIFTITSLADEMYQEYISHVIPNPRMLLSDIIGLLEIFDNIGNVWYTGNLSRDDFQNHRSRLLNSLAIADPLESLQIYILPTDNFSLPFTSFLKIY